MLTPREIIEHSWLGWQTLRTTEKRIHLSCWLVGLIVFNIPRFELTVGLFHGADFSLLFPSSYGVILNAILMYATINVIYDTKGRKLGAALRASVGIYLLISLVEGILDTAYFAWHYQYLSPAVSTEIIIGCLLMNALFFYLPAVVMSIIREWSQQNPAAARITVPDGKELRYLAPQDLLFVAGEGNYVCYHTRQGKILSRQTLATLEGELPTAFVRCHRSYIVNTTLVERFSARTLVLANQEVPVGRTFKRRIKAQLAIKI